MARILYLTAALAFAGVAFASNGWTAITVRDAIATQRHTATVVPCPGLDRMPEDSPFRQAACYRARDSISQHQSALNIFVLLYRYPRNGPFDWASPWEELEEDGTVGRVLAVMEAGRVAQYFEVFITPIQDPSTVLRSVHAWVLARPVD